MTQEMVSVMLPCYNANATLPRALASLIAQTYTNWECVVVDDGSVDSPQVIVEAANDPRINLVTLERNYGRGVARQVALDRATGSYLAMLDADDWYYPSKLQRQVDVMEAEPRLALVSAGMAIVNVANDIVGVRGAGSRTREATIAERFAALRMPRFAHAPSLLRMAVARSARYDSRLPLAEDVDFLIQAMHRRWYIVLPDLSYAYSEMASITAEKIISSVRLTRLTFGKYVRQFPVRALTYLAAAAVKERIYQAAFALGLGASLVQRRSLRPSHRQFNEFLEARTRVAETELLVFGKADTR